MIHDFDGIFKTELTLFDESFGRVNSDRNTFAVISRRLAECFDIFKVTDCVRQELVLLVYLGKEGT
jgi:hypothetical protein